MNDKLRNKLIWSIIAITFIFNIVKVIVHQGIIVDITPAVSVLTLITFSVLHGSKALGMKRLVIFFLITFCVSWLYETLSILTGFPFGNYYYTEVLGPKLGLVPILIMPAYFAVCYLSWNMAHIALDKFDIKNDRLTIFIIPVLAAFIMVMWDMSMDPITATYRKLWIWKNGGGYFGIPFSNFMGWYLCVYTVFQLFAAYLNKTGKESDSIENLNKIDWLQVTLVYGSLVIEFVLLPVFGVNEQMVDNNNHIWNTKDMHETLALVSIFTMFFVTCLCFFKIVLSKRLK